MPTPVSPDRLEHHLKRIKYDPNKTKFLVDGFRYGFKIKHEGTLTEEEPDNDQSIRDYPQAAKEKIDGEVSKGRMMGPFDTPRLKNSMCPPSNCGKK